ncbi:hypothetical protein D932_00874 [Enterococcus casseliflavus 14-MB-W-14]|nr:hypothetical protein D932_00874 [Enterococcus casseliflavus 14-MB-W-14]
MQKKTIPRNQKELSFAAKGTIVKNVGKKDARKHMGKDNEMCQEERFT